GLDALQVRGALGEFGLQLLDLLAVRTARGGRAGTALGPGTARGVLVGALGGTVRGGGRSRLVGRLLRRGRAYLARPGAHSPPVTEREARRLLLLRRLPFGRSIRHAAPPSRLSSSTISASTTSSSPPAWLSPDCAPAVEPSPPPAAWACSCCAWAYIAVPICCAAWASFSEADLIAST